MFIQHLATTTHNVVKAERKPRRNIQYRDVASAVAKTDNLEFLVDVVPKTTTYKEFKKRQEAKQEAAAAAKGKEKEKEKEKAAGAGTGSGGTSAQNGSIKPATSGPVGPGAISLLNEENVQPETTLQNGRSRESMPGPIQEAEPEAMEVDDAKAQEVVRPEKKDEVSSEPEEDPAAMQIQMEMRGPRTNGSPEIRRTSGFTAINGTK